MKKFVPFLFSFIIIYASASAQKNLTLVSTINYGQVLAGVWHYNDNSGHEYALIGANDGILIADITNAASPVMLDTIPAPISIWHELTVLGDYAYCVTEGFGIIGVDAGLLVIDLTTLPGPVNYKFWTGDGAILNQLNTAHTIKSDNGYVYINGSNLGNGGVLFIDVSNPYFPAYAGMYSNQYVHDSYIMNDTLFTSEILAGRFAVIDVSDKTNPIVMATQATPGNFNHNIWPSDNHGIVFTADEVNNAPVGSYDITDLSNIQLLDVYLCDTLSTAEVHNVRVWNDWLICPSYGSQLTLVDAARPANLIEVGHYITGTYLCWDADPYLPSGHVLATDYNGIFYIFQPDYIRACYLEGNVQDTATNFPINGVNVQILLTNKTTTTIITGDYKTGVADSGYYSVQFTKAGYYPKTITGVHLQNGVLTTLNVKLIPIGFSIAENENGNFIRPYPNPATDKINFEIKEGIKISENISLSIYDIIGKKVFENDLDLSKGDKFSVPTSETGKGIFTYELKSQQKTLQRGKFIIE
ncbi:MAG TPA: choice-of-anchor B family protein [Bacteroidia bacterium]|nr:choice-of-anchor B family protein [Bacteroidia bacterium]